MVGGTGKTNAFSGTFRGSQRGRWCESEQLADVTEVCIDTCQSRRDGFTNAKRTTIQWDGSTKAEYLHKIVNESTFHYIYIYIYI